jgi:hypothetical protein
MNLNEVKFCFNFNLVVYLDQQQTKYFNVEPIAIEKLEIRVSPGLNNSPLLLNSSGKSNSHDLVLWEEQTASSQKFNILQENAI